jgi:outer membrane protein TolC
MRARLGLMLKMAGISLLLCPPGAFGQGDEDAEKYEPPDFISEPAELPDVLAEGRPKRLSLTDAVQTAVKHNLGVVLSRQQRKLATLGERAARGTFEPTLSADYRQSDTIRPPVDTNEGPPGSSITTTTNSWNAAVRYPIKTGGLLSLAFNNFRINSDAANALGDTFDSSLAFTVMQPLLRGFSLDLDIPKADILRAELSSEQAREAMRGTLMNVVRETANAYWDLVQTLKAYGVQQGALDLAKEQMTLTERQIRAGVEAPASRIQAESTLAQRELSMVEAERAIEAAADNLRRILALPEGQWSRPIIPVDAPDFAEASPSLEEALTTANDNRPELAQQKIDITRAKLDGRVADNGVLPNLDLSFTYQLNGQDFNYTKTVNNAFSADQRALTVMLNFSWTPFMQASKARAEQARVAKRSAEVQLEQVEIRIETEVRASIRALRSASRQVRAAARFRKLAERSLDIERRKFVDGTSNNFLVAQRQEELSQARQSELAAVIAHRKALTNLELSTGTLLDARNIELDVAGKR